MSGNSAEAEEQWIRQSLAAHLTLPPNLSFHAIPIDEVGYVAIIGVPPSPNGPHAQIDPADSTRALRYPIRRGRDTFYMTESEVANAYQNRLYGWRNREERNGHAIAEAIENLPGGDDAVWVWVLAAPEVLLPTRIMTSTVVSEMRKWELDHGATEGFHHSPLAHERDVLGIVVPGPGKATLRGRFEDSYAELHIDGRAFSAEVVRSDDADQISLLGLLDHVITTADHALRFTLDQTGPSGVITSYAGIARGHNADLLTPAVAIATTIDGTFAPVAGGRSLFRSPRIVTTAEASSLTTASGRLAACHDIAVSLLAHFGTIDTAYLGSGGVVRQDARSAADVARWAARYGISHE